MLFLAIAAAGSSRNYGVRYLLPLAPAGDRLGLAAGRGGRRERRRWPQAGRRWVVGAGTGRAGARRRRRSPVRADLLQRCWPAARWAAGTSCPTPTSTGARGSRAWPGSSAREPEFRDLTLYYFGDTDPTWYGVEGVSHVVNAVDDHPDLPAASRRGTRGTSRSRPRSSGARGGRPGSSAELDGVAPGPHDRRHDDRDLPRGRPERAGRKQPPDSEYEEATVGTKSLGPGGASVHSQGRPAPGIGTAHPPRTKAPQGRRWSACRGSIPPGVATSALPGREPEACIPIPEEARPLSDSRRRLRLAI